MIWKKKSEILMINKLYIKQCCLIVWVDKIKKVKILKFLTTKSRRIMLLSKCEMCDIKRSKFIK